jgi:hypothetical protein
MLRRRRFLLALGSSLGAAAGGVSMAADNPSDRRWVRSTLFGYTGQRPEPWAPGYTQAELDAAQARYGLVFPPDLVALLRHRRPAQGYDWRNDDRAIREILGWPLEGLAFDVEEAGLWWPEWGERPSTPPARREVVASVLNHAPKLIPIFSHRFIPEQPHEAGNPVFSVYQSDVVYYGSDLADYFRREFGDPGQPLAHQPRRIRFWSDLVERSGRPEYYPFGQTPDGFPFDARPFQ